VQLVLYQLQMGHFPVFTASYVLFSSVLVVRTLSQSRHALVVRPYRLTDYNAYVECSDNRYQSLGMFGRLSIVYCLPCFFTVTTVCAVLTLYLLVDPCTSTEASHDHDTSQDRAPHRREIESFAEAVAQSVEASQGKRSVCILFCL
jgi:hypothetical protein